MRFGFFAVGFLGLVVVSGICGPASAFDPNNERTPRLGPIVNTAPHRSGLMYLAPGRVPDAPRRNADDTKPELRRDGKRQWSPQWIADCAARHKGFDRQTGTYLAANGEYKFCD